MVNIMELNNRVDLSVEIAGVKFKNPVTVCSGTFGQGAEYVELYDIGGLGAITTKSVANNPWQGNDTPRVVEVYGGMLNAIGLQNAGAQAFLDRELEFLSELGTNIIVNICGRTKEDYIEAVKMLDNEKISMFEINISCPNVKEGGIAFGQSAECVYDITREIKNSTKKPVIMKLSPNVTDICEIAKAAEKGGADALSLINTLIGTKIDINKRAFVLANKTGGFSGPAIKPVALRMVYQVANSVNIPIIGMGGISSADDAIEFLLAGASMISVGTANFYNQYIALDIIKGIEAYLVKNNFTSVKDIIGIVK